MNMYIQKQICTLCFDLSMYLFHLQLSSNLTNYNLSELANSLQSIISALPATDDTNLRSDLQLSLLHLNTYEEKLIKPMKEVSLSLTVRFVVQ